MTNPNRLLVIDDESAVRAFYRDAAEAMGYAVAEAGNRAEFIEVYASFRPTVIILDLAMPRTDGVEFLRDLGERQCSVPILIASGSDTRVLAAAQRVGRGYGLTIPQLLAKPVSLPQLEIVLEALLIASSALRCSDLQRAIENEELVLFYQPKVSLRHGDELPVIGGEALVRWQHDERGLVEPDEFISLAEDGGLMGALTDTVLRQAIRQLAAWREMGLELPVSVNLSASSLTDLTLPDQISGLLAAESLKSSLLELEVTEQAAMADITKANDILTRLRLKEIAVSLDDFGSGFSSLVEIYRLPLSELKIDRSLVAELDHSDDARTVMRALVALASMLHLPVCVEGVETRASLEFLQSTGCDAVQGFLISRPLPAIQYVKFVKSWTGRAILSNEARTASSAGSVVQFGRECG